MPDNMSVAQRSWTMSQIRSKDTKPERIVRSFLHTSGYRFRLHQHSLPGVPDIVLPRFRVAIFVHGCFWHRHSNCRYATCPRNNKRYWRQKLAGNVLRDQKNIKALKSAGWHVITIWECQIKSSPVKVQQHLFQALKKMASHISCD